MAICCKYQEELKFVEKLEIYIGKTWLNIYVVVEGWGTT